MFLDRHAEQSLVGWDTRSNRPEQTVYHLQRDILFLVGSFYDVSEWQTASCAESRGWRAVGVDLHLLCPI